MAARDLIRWLGCLAVVVGTSPLEAQETHPDTALPPAWATVASRSGDLLYLEVGSRLGIREGLELELVRLGEVIGHLRARYVSSSRTAAAIVDTLSTPVIGDSVRYQPAPAAPEERPVVSEASRPRQRRRAPPLRGRVGVRYLMITQPNGVALHQPAFDLRLTGTRLGGTGLGLAVDVRAQRTTVNSGASREPTSLTRVYQAAMHLQSAGTGPRVALGRQYATALSPIGIFDGLAVDLNGSAWSAGLLAGTQPDAGTFAPSGETTEFGAWLQRHNSPGSPSRWTATLGLVGSYHLGEINREFAYLRATYATRGLMLYAAQEIDANRGWRREVEGQAATLTSSFATARLTVADPVTVSAGVDSRRRVRLYRDFLNPEIAFDDATREGYWGELALRLGSRLRVTTSARESAAGSSGGIETLTASLYANRLTPLHLSVRLRSSRYAGPVTEGTLASAMVEASPHQSLRVSLNAGQRTTRTMAPSGTDTRLTWIGSDLDLALNRSVYLMLSTYRESGAESATIQNYFSLTWRF